MSKIVASKLSNVDDKEKLNIVLTEYQMLKDEEKTLFSFEFTCMSIWFTFLAAILGVTFSLYGNLYGSVEKIAETAEAFDQILQDVNRFQSVRETISVIFTVLLPGCCSFFGLFYLDLTCRFIKEAHYLFIIEKKLAVMLGSPAYMGFESYVLENSDNKSRGIFFLRSNYLMYCFVLGVLLLCPILVTGMMETWQNIIPWIEFQIFGLRLSFRVVFVLLELFTLVYSILYIHEILSYAADKKKINDDEDKNKISNKTSDHNPQIKAAEPGYSSVMRENRHRSRNKNRKKARSR